MIVVVKVSPVTVCEAQSVASAVLVLTVSVVAPLELMVSEVPLATSPAATLNVGVSGTVSSALPSS